MIRYGLFFALILTIGYVCLDLGIRGARAYERMQLQRIDNALSAVGMTWAEARADGLQVQLHGHAPDLFAQEMALETARATAPMAEVANYSTATLAPPEQRPPVRIEILRDVRGITLTGQTASRAMRQTLSARLNRDAPALEVRDLTGIQGAPPPDGWGPEIDVASLATSRLDNAYVVIAPGSVTVAGGVPDAMARQALTDELLARAGDDLALVLNLNIPPRVVAPFAFSAYKDSGGGIRLERCTARDLDEQAMISAALQRPGVEQRAEPCPVGLGGPNGNWRGAIEAGLGALARLPAGRLDLEYHNAHLTAAPPSTPAILQDALADLQREIPAGYMATGELQAEDAATLAGISRERYWLRITHAPRGLTLAGTVPKGSTRAAIEIYAAARFGQARVHSALLESPDPAPPGWKVGALRVLDRLRTVHAGEAEFAGHRLILHADVSDPAAVGALHRGLQQELPEFDIATRVRVDLPASVTDIPLPARPCATALERLVNAAPIDFDTGSAVITAGSAPVLDQLADQLAGCRAEPIEVGGHTDSQGSEDLNLRISKARADAVRTALINRGIAHDLLEARGYGETEPVADNATEPGRARNRRITFAPAPPARQPAKDD